MTEHPTITIVRVFKDVSGDWRWAGFSSNGEEIDQSSEGYQNHLDALGAAKAANPTALVEDNIIE